MKQYIRSNEYDDLKRNYKYFKEFKDKDTQSGNIRDFTDELDRCGTSYEVYDNKTNRGCTVFYDEIVNSCIKASIEEPQNQVNDRINNATYEIEKRMEYIRDALDYLELHTNDLWLSDMMLINSKLKRMYSDASEVEEIVLAAVKSSR